jgi:hypothetical protein
VEVVETNNGNLRLFQAFALPGEGGKMLRCGEVHPMKYGKDDEEGEEDGEIRASCFPESNVGLLIDSTGSQLHQAAKGASLSMHHHEGV